MSNYILIIYSVIIIILFIIWYNMSNKILIKRINTYCNQQIQTYKNKQTLNTNVILWDIISRFIVFVIIGYIIIYIFNTYFIAN